MRFKESDESLPDIAQKLNVDAIVEGSVLRAGEKVRITTQLVKSAPEKHLWADDYERDFQDILALQKDVARAIAREIKVVVTPEEQAKLTTDQTVNPEAYQLYLQGRFYWNKRTEVSLKKAIEYFEESIRKDPNYALAYTGLADSYILLPVFSSYAPNKAYPKAKKAATKALQLDNRLAEAHNSLACIIDVYEMNQVEAGHIFRRAIELSPGYATAHHWYAYNFLEVNRFEEALKEIKRAHELDPLSLIINRDMGEILYFARQYDKAIVALRKTMEMEPNFSQVHLYLGKVYLQKSMYKEAMVEFQKEKELMKTWNPFVESWMAIAFAKSGNKNRAKQILDKLVKIAKEEYVSPFNIAIVYFALEEEDKGLGDIAL